jgi:flavodoxin
MNEGYDDERRLARPNDPGPRVTPAEGPGRRIGPARTGETSPARRNATMQVVIIYESLTGTTENVARLIANAFYERQVPSKIYPVDGYDPAAIDEADVVIAGSWTDGLFLVGQKPAKRKRFAELPALTHKKCVVFCTYAVDPGKTLDKLAKVLTSRGGDVLGGLAIKRTEQEYGAADLVDRVMDVVSV